MTTNGGGDASGLPKGASEAGEAAYKVQTLGRIEPDGPEDLGTSTRVLGTML